MPETPNPISAAPPEPISVLWLSLASNLTDHGHEEFIRLANRFNCSIDFIRLPPPITDSQFQSLVQAADAFVVTMEDVVGHPEFRNAVVAAVRGGKRMLVLGPRRGLNPLLIEFDLGVSEDRLCDTTTFTDDDRTLFVRADGTGGHPVAHALFENSPITTVGGPTRVWYGVTAVPTLKAGPQVRLLTPGDFFEPAGPRLMCCGGLWPLEPKTAEGVLLIAGNCFRNPFVGPTGKFFPGIRANIALAESVITWLRGDSQRPQELGWPGSDRWEEVLPDLTKQAANGPRPLALDPFAGGGSIPLEFSRVGADAFASDLNPIPVLLNKVILEFIPKHGQRLADEVRRWGKWIEDRACAELQEFYPTGKNGAEPIAYLWARQIRCEGPSCGAEFPLMRSLWLAKRDGSSTALRLVTKATPRELHFEIIENADVADVGSGTVARSSGTCPFCGFTTPASSVRNQLKPRRGGTHDALLIAVREDDPAGGRTYRLPTDTDRRAASSAAKELGARTRAQVGGLSIVPNEPYPDETGAGALSSSVLFGFKTWGDIFTPRQALALTTFVRLIERASVELSSGDSDLDRAIVTCLAQAVNRTADFCTSLCRLNSTGGRGVVNTFSRQALPMLWDFFETNPFNKVGANWSGSIEACVSTVENELHNKHLGTVERVSATKHVLPDDAAHLFVTDPPYYDAIAYGDLSDFFYVWLKRTVGRLYPALFSNTLVDKTDEVVHLSKRFRGPYAHKTKEYFEDGMQAAMREGRRILHSSGIGVVVFAHKSTSGWESMLQALIDAGWTVTGSWPIDTERGGRMNAIGTAALASSVHIVCRPRESIAAASNLNEVGDWRDILQELPRRIHEWMPRLAQEGVVGADAIFACLGPALEIYSR